MAKLSNQPDGGDDAASRGKAPAPQLWCRCGTDKNPISCVGGCSYLCQRIVNGKSNDGAEPAPDPYYGVDYDPTKPREEVAHGN